MLKRGVKKGREGEGQDDRQGKKNERRRGGKKGQRWWGKRTSKVKKEGLRRMMLLMTLFQCKFSYVKRAKVA
jgi:hypothetical protein